MNPFDGKIDTGGGVLTAEDIAGTLERARKSGGRVYSRFLFSPKQYEQMLEWQRWETWVSTLSPRQQKCERLKYEIRHRKKLRPMPLPD